jgi:DNA-binding NtrC family response regulator
MRYANKTAKRPRAFNPLAMDILLKYEWPGNVRELENAVERAVILLTGDHVTEKQLPLNMVKGHPCGQASRSIRLAILDPEPAALPGGDRKRGHSLHTGGHQGQQKRNRPPARDHTQDITQ